MGRLGRGSTSHVFKTQSIKTKQFYAMKVIDKFDSNYSLALLQRELAIHRKLSNQHVVQLIEHMEDSENHYLLAEYCADGEATKFLLDRNISEETVRRVAHDVSCGLDYLHNEARIAHGDVKLSNILISNNKIVFFPSCRNSAISASPCPLISLLTLAMERSCTLRRRSSPMALWIRRPPMSGL